jgi:type VI secretion system secreted protein VgrG
MRSNEINGKRNNHLILDDTPGEIQAQLSSDHQLSQLNLGFITRVPYWSGRKDKRGEGFELRTDGHGVVRAAHGMLVTTEGRTNASGHAKEMGETVQRLTQAREQHEDLSKLAQQHKAQSVEANQNDVTRTIKRQNDAIRGGATSTAQSELTAPHLVVSSAAGIGLTSAQSTHLASQLDLAITTGCDASLSVGRSLLAAVRGAVSIFAERLGIKLFAAKGKVEIQAHADNIELTAQKTIKVVSVTESIEITAKQEILLTSGGAYIRIKDGNIEIGAPGKVELKGKCLISAPASVSSPKFELPQGDGVARKGGYSLDYSG